MRSFVLSDNIRRTLRRPPAPLLPTGTRATLLTLLAPGAVGPPVADRHSTTSAGRHAVINLTEAILEIATPAAVLTQQVSDRQSHRCARALARAVPPVRAERRARPHPAAGPRAP
jgi:hypothetical protein